MYKKVFRNQAKVITEKDGKKDVNDDYAVELNGHKYPLMSAKMTGFINGLNKNGATRKKKIMSMSAEDKQQYIDQCKSILDFDPDTAKSIVGDAKTPKPITKEVKYKPLPLGIKSVKIDMKTEMPESLEYQVNSTKENPEVPSNASNASSKLNSSNARPSNARPSNASNASNAQTFSDLKPINDATVNQGLDSQFQQDDGKTDTSKFYQFLINKYFSILDFTRVLAYVKQKNKNVEKMSPEQIISLSKDIAQELGTSLKYMNNDIKTLRQQLYELLALQIGKSKQEPTVTEKNNIGLIVDFDSVFGPDFVLDKDKFKQEFMESKNGSVPDVMQSIIPPPVTSQYKNTAVPTSVGSNKNEGAYTDPAPPESHRNFNLADSVLKYDSSFSQQFAKKINDISDEFVTPNIFRFRKDDSELNRIFKRLL